MKKGFTLVEVILVYKLFNILKSINLTININIKVLKKFYFML